MQQLCWICKSCVHISKQYGIQDRTTLFWSVRLRLYAPTLIHIWSRINETSGLNICKMVKKTKLKIRSFSFSLFQYHVIISFILI